MSKTQTTIIYDDSKLTPVCHHMPDNAKSPALRNGMTLRAALKELRRTDWGDMGGLLSVDLSDGTYIEVELQECDGGELMGSQHVRRYGNDRGAEYTVRCYNL